MRFQYLVVLAMLIKIIFSQAGYSQVNKKFESPEYINYDYLPQCLGALYLKGDSLKYTNGNLAEINFLKSQIETCDAVSSITSRIAMKYLEWGDVAYNEKGVSDEKLRRELFDESLIWAKKAIEEDPNNHFNYEVTSMSFAAILSMSKLKTKALLADSVRIYAENCIKLNDKNDRAFHILGRWQFEVAKLGKLKRYLSRLFFGNAPVGSYDEAINYFSEASQIKNIIIHNYWLGVSYLENGNKEKAIEYLRLTQTLPKTQENDDFFLAKAKEILSDIQ